MAPTTSSSPPPLFLPVISVRDAVYEYETVGTPHSQTDADTQDTVKHQRRGQRHKRSGHTGGDGAQVTGSAK